MRLRPCPAAVPVTFRNELDMDELVDEAYFMFCKVSTFFFNSIIHRVVLSLKMNKYI